MTQTKNEKQEPQSSIAEPKLMLLDVNNPTTFIPSGKPYRFFVRFIGKQMMVSNNASGEVVFAMPGVKMDKGVSHIGVLIVDEKAFSKIRVTCGKESPIGKEIIFITPPSSFEFKAFKNPPCHTDVSLLTQANAVCADLENIVVSGLGVAMGDEFSNPPFSINSSTAFIE